MEITFDPEKDAKNRLKHHISLREAGAFRWRDALVQQDVRTSYAEPRFIGYGFVGIRLHVLVFTLREGGLRVISLRKANEREQKKYAESQKTQ